VDHVNGFGQSVLRTGSQSPGTTRCLMIVSGHLDISGKKILLHQLGERQLHRRARWRHGQYHDPNNPLWVSVHGVFPIGSFNFARCFQNDGGHCNGSTTLTGHSHQYGSVYRGGVVQESELYNSLHDERASGPYCRYRIHNTTPGLPCGWIALRCRRRIRYGLRPYNQVNAVNYPRTSRSAIITATTQSGHAACLESWGLPNSTSTQSDVFVNVQIHRPTHAWHLIYAKKSKGLHSICPHPHAPSRYPTFSFFPNAE